MKSNEFHTAGRTNSKGQILIAGQQKLNEFAAQHPDHSFTITFTFSKKGSTNAQRGYYSQAVIPQVQKAMMYRGDRKTKKEVDEILREESPICLEEIWSEDEGGFVGVAVKSVTALNTQEMYQHLEHCKQWAAVNLDLAIEDPKYI